MPYYKVTALASEIIEAKDKDDAIEQLASIIREFGRGELDWKFKGEDVTEDSFPSNLEIGFPLVE